MKSAIELAKKLASELSPRSPSHGYDHVERVVRNVLELAKHVGGVDMDVLLVAAYLHDIGRGLPGDHAEISAEIAYAVLIENGFDKDFAERVREAILCHSYNRVFVAGYQCRSLEGQVLSDADKIDASGALGIARAFTHGGETGRSITASLEHLRSKILRLHKCAFTEEGRKKLNRLVKRVEEFLNWIEEELGQCAKPSS